MGFTAPLGGKQAWVLLLPLISCVTLSKLLLLSDRQFIVKWGS
jgi:hypothetical protein